MRATGKESKQGFTLIELLIVVLIIAILAAIAVPNFLEFQTRAKTSRAMADMRNLKTAIEAYQVDNDDYPPSLSSYNPVGSLIPYEERYAHITTPIAYISTAPKDVFGVVPPPAWPNGDPNNRTGLYDYWDLRAAELSNGSQFTPWNFPHVSSAKFKHYQYQLRSLGPDLLYEGNNFSGTGPYAGVVTPYDPTNGTVSRGDILMWGPGSAIGWE